MLRSVLRWYSLLLLLRFACAVAAKSIYPDFGTESARQVLRLAKSAEMRNFMKSDVEPCEDFYAYACGNWENVNPASIADVKTGLFNRLKDSYDRRVALLMREPKCSTESDIERKVKYFYESCMDRKELSENYREKLVSVMEEFGGMPALKGAQWNANKFDWLKVVAQILRKYGKAIIIGVDIGADLANNEVNRLYLGQVDKLVEGRRNDFYSHLRSARTFELIAVLGLSSKVAGEVARETTEFERNLAAGMADPHQGLGMEDKTRLRLLDEMTENYKPELNFTLFVTTWLGYEYRLPVYEYVESYVQNLRDLIEKTPKDVIANYIMWELLQDFRLEAAETDRKQEGKCVEKTKKFFVKYLDNMVYRQLQQHNSGVVDDVRHVWRELKLAFEDMLNSNTSSWLSEMTRDKALEKLSAMTLEVRAYEGEDFGKEFGDLAIGTDSYFENVINVLELRGRNYRMKLQEPPSLDESSTINFTPVYGAEVNRVFISVAFLQPRFLYDDVYPVALKFATVGFIIAHEMTHGFDDNSRKYDAKGNLNNWWDRVSTEAFNARKECLRLQYGGFKYAGEHLMKTHSQNENIADIVGVRIAYVGYEKWLRQQRHNSSQLQAEKLPHVDLTPRQLFFVGAAQLWCSDVHKYLRHLVSTTDVHAPEEARVKGMMSNFDEFAKEFKCRPGQTMHPERKCMIY